MVVPVENGRLLTACYLVKMRLKRNVKFFKWRRGKVSEDIGRQQY